MKAAAERVEAQKAAGEKPSPQDERLAEGWNNGLQQVRLSDTGRRSEGVEQRAGGVSRELSWNREVPGTCRSFFMQTIGVLLFGMGFMAIGRMLIGMGLMKLGVFSAERSRRFYLVDGRRSVMGSACRSWSSTPWS